MPETAAWETEKETREKVAGVFRQLFEETCGNDDRRRYEQEMQDFVLGRLGEGASEEMGDSLRQLVTIFYGRVHSAAWRSQFLEALSEEGFDLRLYGNDWERHPRLGHLGASAPVKDSADDEPFERLQQAVQDELQGLSNLNEQAGQEQIRKVLGNHGACEAALAEVVVDYKQTQLAKMMTEIRDCLGGWEEEPGRMARRFNQGVLGGAWGSPNQFFVFRREMLGQG
jgi:hypothetical protein